MAWRKWAVGLLVAVIDGAASGGLLMLIDPATFNVEHYEKLLALSVAFGLKGALLYLKEHAKDLQELES